MTILKAATDKLNEIERRNTNLPTIMRDFKKLMIEEALLRNGGNMSEACKELGVTRSSGSKWLDADSLRKWRAENL